MDVCLLLSVLGCVVLYRQRPCVGLILRPRSTTKCLCRLRSPLRKAKMVRVIRTVEANWKNIYISLNIPGGRDWVKSRNTCQGVLSSAVLKFRVTNEN
jgi:hypothetical protein